MKMVVVVVINDEFCGGEAFSAGRHSVRGSDLPNTINHISWQ
jgi:hypothetical protein